MSTNLREEVGKIDPLKEILEEVAGGMMGLALLIREGGLDGLKKSDIMSAVASGISAYDTEQSFTANLDSFLPDDE